MKQRIGILLVLVSVLVILILGSVVARVRAQAGTAAPPYTLARWTVDSGGMTSGGNRTYYLGGTAGQPDAAVWSGSDYTLAGGFWGGTAAAHRIFLPLVLRGM